MQDAVSQAVSNWAEGGRHTLLQLLTNPQLNTVALYQVVEATLRSYTAVPSAELASLVAEAVVALASNPSSSTSSFNPLLPVLANNIYTIDTSLEDAALPPSSDPAAKVAAKAARSPWTAFCRDLWAKDVLPLDFYDRFEYGFLARLRLTGADENVMTRRNTRASTVKFYSLKKYNLLRESSEGYSLLLVLLHSEENLGPGKDPSTGWDVESDQARARRAALLWEKVKSVIGYFELDPNRSLDIILDAFLPHILTHHRIFLSLLLCSPWAPPTNSTSSINTSEQDLEGERGRSVVAQVLGFKFRYYQGQDVMREGKETPREMYLLAAMAIKEGFVRLQDLWSHLGPEEAEMDSLESKWRVEVNQIARSSKGNAMLASAAPLIDDDAPEGSTSKDAEAGTEEAPLPLLPLPQQKLPLVHALLVIGAHGHVDHLLCRFPHLPNADPAIADLLLRKLDFILQPLLQANHVPAQGYSRPRNGLPNKVSKLTFEVSIDAAQVATKEKKFVGFCPEWSVGLSTVDSLEGLFELGKQKSGVLDLLRLLGAQLSRRKELLIKLVRIGRKAVEEDPDSKSHWNDLLRLSFLPSLSLSGGCNSTSQEIWALLSLYGLETRYGLYGFWRSLYTASLQLKIQAATAERDAKAVLRRVSKDDLKLHARALGKLSHSDPLILWSVVLRQIQSYENLVKPVVESARYITPLGADVIIFSLLDAFSNPDKERTKTDGTSTSLWLKSLASFAGELCRRHSQMIDCRPILHYITNQLRAGNPKDLIILREIVSAMTAIDPLANLSDNQVSAMGGGATLRSEAIHPTVSTLKAPPLPGVEVRAEPIVEKRGVTAKSSVRLMTSLEEDGLVLPLLIAVAQARESCVFTVSEEDAHMKHLSSLFDSSTEILFQYVEFLLQHLTPERYAALVPSYPDLAEKFGLSPSLAFLLLRPKLSLDMKVYDHERALELSKAKEARLRLELKAKGSAATALSNDPTTSDQASSAPVSPVPAASTSNGSESKYHASLRPVILTAHKVFSEEHRSTLGAPFFVTFWQMTPFDLEVPISTYQKEIDRLDRACADLGRFPANAQTDEWKRQRDLLQSKAKDLGKERDEQMQAYTTAKRRLSTEKSVWFRKASDSRVLNAQIFQQCIFPRSLLSLADASYCARFLKTMHTLGTHSFYSLWFYNDFVFTEWIAPLVASFTETEARNYARFIHDCLESLSSWRDSESLYAREAHGEPTLVPGFRQSRVRDLKEKLLPVTLPDLLPWNGFRKVMHKLTSRFVTALELCLASDEYMHIKNVVILLQKILPFFPREKGQGAQIETLIKGAIATERREDVKLLMLSYSSQLGKLKPQWLPQEQLMDLSFKTKGSSVISTASSLDGGKPVDADKSTNGATVGIPEPTKVAMDVDDAPSSSTTGQSNGSAPIPPSANLVEPLQPTRPSTPAAVANSSATPPSKPHSGNAEADALRAKLQAASTTSGDKSIPSAPRSASTTRAPSNAPSGPMSYNDLTARGPIEAPLGPKGHGGPTTTPAFNTRSPAAAATALPSTSSATPAGNTSGHPSLPARVAPSTTRPQATTAASGSNGPALGLPSRPSNGNSTSQTPPPPQVPAPALSRHTSTSQPERRPAPPPAHSRTSSSRRSASPNGRRSRRANSVESTRSKQSGSTRDRDPRRSETETERAERKQRERLEDAGKRRRDDRDDRERLSRKDSDQRGKDQDSRDQDSGRDSRGKERDTRDRDYGRGDKGRDSRSSRDDRDRDRDSRDPKRPRREESSRSAPGIPVRRSPSPSKSIRGEPSARLDAPPRSSANPSRGLPDRPNLPINPSLAGSRQRTPDRATARERAITPPLSQPSSSSRGGLPPRPSVARGGLSDRIGVDVGHPKEVSSVAASAESRKRNTSQRDDTPPNGGPSDGEQRPKRIINRNQKYSAISKHLGGDRPRR